jgi:lysophospholipase L1-like esterase
MRATAALALAIALAAFSHPGSADAQAKSGRSIHWTTAWAASVQGPYPVGNPSAQPDLSRVFPVPENGARDQSFRLIVRPDVWGPTARFRLSNALGTRPVTFGGVYAGLQLSGPALIARSNQAVKFGGQASVTVAPGESVWSDPVSLPFARNVSAMAGRKLAVSFHVAGESGPMTWHAKALTSSYVSLPGSGSHGGEESEASFPASTASWYFLDAVDMQTPPSTKAIVAFGDSITDGTASTMNGDDRWPDVLSRRIHAQHGERYAVINAGIGGNQVVGPAQYSPQQPFPGGPSAGMRLERDVLSLSNVGALIWLEGINDFSKNGNASAEAVIEGMKQGVARIREKIPGVRVIGATVTSALGSTSGAHGFPEQDAKRKALNDFIRNSGTFDAVADFDRATLDAATGGMRAEFVPESTTGGAGDKLHPNRMGYQAMGAAVDIPSLLPKGR